VGDRVLLCEERLDFHCTVEESPGMPWARAKFQVPLPKLPRVQHASLVQEGPGCDNSNRRSMP
jgi:hypothetical protein